MSSNSIQSDIDSILNVLKTSADGASINELLNALKSQMTKRTMQRRLKLMIEQSHIESVGLAQAVRYKIKTISDKETKMNEPLASLPNISSNGEKVKKYITQDLINRKPVGYNREFLENHH